MTTPRQPGWYDDQNDSNGQKPQLDIDGTYLWRKVHIVCHGIEEPLPPEFPVSFTHQGNTLTIGNATGTLNADGSFVVRNSFSMFTGVFATKGGRTIVRDGVKHSSSCDVNFVATKQ